MAEPKKIVRLAELRGIIVGQIEDNSGVTHDVLNNLDFDEHQRLKESETNGDGVIAMRDAVKRVVPTLSDKEIGTINSEQAQAILMLAGAGLAAVERLFPNAVRSETA